MTNPTRSPHAPARICAIGMLGILLAACFGNPPGVAGVAGTAPAPSAFWTPPAAHRESPEAPAPIVIPPDLAARVAELKLSDVIDIALRNNTLTRISWAQARSAAAAFGAAKGQYYPSLSIDGTGTALKTAPIGGRSAVSQRYYGPSLNLSWLLLDFGERAGTVGEARETLLAADWTHNATVQNVVLAVEQAYFLYMGTKALLAAQQVTLKEAQTNLDAAEERHKVGLATIADVLLAKTALSQAQLAVESTEGELQTTRGALALSMGLPANIPYDIEIPQDSLVPLGVTESVDSLIERAVRDRPDLAAARAQARASRERVTAARGQALPSLSVAGRAGETYVVNNPTSGNSYTATLTLQIPIFSGWSQIYNVKAAAAAADAAALQAQSAEQQVGYQVFNSYYGLRTATQRVRTSGDLLTSATQAEQVALGRYKAGVGSLLDLLTAQAALADARAQSIQSRFSWYTALAQLSRDAGVLGLDGGSPLHLEPDTTGSK